MNTTGSHTFGILLFTTHTLTILIILKEQHPYKRQKLIMFFHVDNIHMAHSNYFSCYLHVVNIQNASGMNMGTAWSQTISAK